MFIVFAPLMVMKPIGFHIIDAISHYAHQQRLTGLHRVTIPLSNFFYDFVIFNIYLFFFCLPLMISHMDVLNNRRLPKAWKLLTSPMIVIRFSRCAISTNSMVSSTKYPLSMESHLTSEHTSASECWESTDPARRVPSRCLLATPLLLADTQRLEECTAVHPRSSDTALKSTHSSTISVDSNHSSYLPPCTATVTHARSPTSSLTVWVCEQANQTVQWWSASKDLRCCCTSRSEFTDYSGRTNGWNRSCG
ncbi:hypothetical protein PENTCL1PPCAC_2907, partial [Pristionchus entomophagus]